MKTIITYASTIAILTATCQFVPVVTAYAKEPAHKTEAAMTANVSHKNDLKPIKLSVNQMHADAVFPANFKTDPIDLEAPNIEPASDLAEDVKISVPLDLEVNSEFYIGLHEEPEIREIPLRQDTADMGGAQTESMKPIASLGIKANF